VMRLLWQGGYQSHYGKHYTVEQARIYTLPDEPVPIAVAAAQPTAAQLAGRLGDAFVGVSPEAEIVQEFDGSGGSGKPRYGQVTVCYAESEDDAKRTALEIWPNGGMSGPIGQELAIPSHYEAVAELLDEDQVAETVICGPDPERHLEAIREYEQAGYDHVWVHQVGREQDAFLRFYADRILPEL
jgi:coenzyme F420-dependent glucose-6-phosphate dehydrogenase